MSIPRTFIAGFIGLASCGSMGSLIFLNSLWLMAVDPHRGGSISLRPTLRVPTQPWALALASDLRSNLAIYFLDYGRVFAADGPSTSSYAANALLPMSDHILSKVFCNGFIASGVSCLFSRARLCHIMG